jgi:regulator of sirC expression with transglutaminase-like and TPR domain
MYKFTGFDLEVNKPAHYFINEVLDTRNGNNYSLGILYQMICEKLDIPVFAVQLPKQFLLAYFSTQFDFYKKEEANLQIQFFIDPNNGNIYTQNDVDVYLRKYRLKTDEETYLPLSNHQNMYKQLEALSQVYAMTDEEDKAAEIEQIMSLKV